MLQPRIKEKELQEKQRYHAGGREAVMLVRGGGWG